MNGHLYITRLAMAGLAPKSVAVMHGRPIFIIASREYKAPAMSDASLLYERGIAIPPDAMSILLRQARPYWHHRRHNEALTLVNTFSASMEEARNKTRPRRPMP